MTILNRKVFRELARMRGQVIAITLVMACGIMVYVSSRHTYIALLESQESYYTSYRFADVFAGIKRAPAPVAERIARIPGVSSVRTRIVMDVNLDVPGLDEPAIGRLVSMPDVRRPVLNDIAIQEGRYPAVGRPEEVIISEAFALANGLVPDAWIGAVINGRRKALRVVGIGLSPEYVYEVQGSGSIFPDNLRF
ncbi:MAG: ABC transporter permease, partial [Gemmatimonadetes bacterium]|nr:ABC transporter permease [Gemmatimonadota bacterium]